MKDIRKVYSVSYKLMLYFINGNASELCKTRIQLLIQLDSLILTLKLMYFRIVPAVVFAMLSKTCCKLFILI